jgi:hypothetical protein
MDRTKCSLKILIVVFPTSTDVDNPGWNRNSTPFAEASLKLRKQLRLERDGTPSLSTILCCSLEKGNIKMSDITLIMENIIVHYNTEDLNLNPLGDLNYSRYF